MSRNPILCPDPENLPPTSRARIGLLGGSFNPAHRAHRAITAYALQAFALDAVWWLVSPHNPLKDPASLKPYATRLALAQAAAQHVPQLVATDIEARLASRYTIDTLRDLQKKWPQVHWLWLMGADNMVHFQHWHEWEQIFYTVPIAVLRRPPYTGLVAQSPAAIMFQDVQWTAPDKARLLTASLPAWTLCDNSEIDLSATEIRAGSKTAWQ